MFLDMLALLRFRLPCLRCVYLLCMRLPCMLVLCTLALPMLVLCAPAVRSLAVRVCAMRFRAGRVVYLYSARLHRADFFRQRRRHHFQRPSAPSDASARRPLLLMHMHLPYPLTLSPCCRFNPLKTTPGHVVFGLDYSGLAISL